VVHHEGIPPGPVGTSPANAPAERRAGVGHKELFCVSAQLIVNPPSPAQHSTQHLQRA
jgi:hypothetical protein